MNLKTTAELRQRIVTAAERGLIGTDMAALCRDIDTLQAENVRLREAGDELCSALEAISIIAGMRGGHTRLGAAWEAMRKLAPKGKEAEDE